MRSTILLIMIVLVNFSSPVLGAEDRRVIPLDMYLVIDDSTALGNARNDVVAWIDEHVLNRILTEGDRITVYAAGNQVREIYSGTISGSAEKTEIINEIRTLESRGETADFAGALMNVSARVSQTPQSRLAYTMLLTASAAGLEPALAGTSGSLFRWFRSERYERWQVLIVATDINLKVQQAAASYMSSRR